jgi:predicted deacylase
MIEVITFNSPKKGKSILIFGAIHGNETCGTEAITKLIKKIKIGKIVLENGSVTFIPICNPEAYKKNQRYKDENLNRVIKKHKIADSYEKNIANILVKYITKSDYLLDLHSMHENGIPFAFQDTENEEERKFILSLGLEYILKGWSDVYKDCIIKDYTTQHFSQENNVVATTVECGRHGDKNSVKIAEKCIINALKYLKIIEPKTDFKNKKVVDITMQKVFIKKKEGKINSLDHLQLIKKNDTIAFYDDGEKIIATDDCVMILPNYNCQIGEEWFYLGEAKIIKAVSNIIC